MWVKKAGGSVQDENFYCSCVRQLLTARDKTHYTEVLSECMERWSPAFCEYYMASLKEAVLASADFATRHKNLVSLPYVGITNNVSESYNRVLKDFQNWKVK